MSSVLAEKPVARGLAAGTSRALGEPKRDLRPADCVEGSQARPRMGAGLIGRRCLARLSDEEMVKVARGGNAQAVELLMRRHNGLLHRVIQRFRIPGYEYSDLEQLGRLGLLRAIEQFDAAQGCRFSTLATLCILSPLNHAWTSASRKARGGGETEISLDALLPVSVDGEAMDLLSLQGDERTPGPERVILKRDECRRMVAAIQTQVTHPLAPLVIERLALGDGLAEIGRQVGVSRQALEQLVRRMRRAAEREMGMEA